MNKELLIIKIGGRAAEVEESLSALAREMKELSSRYDFILVHGGGAAVSSIQKVYGIEPLFAEGKRITAPEEMDIVDMGLAGKMNKHLVRLFVKAGISGVGLSGCDGELFRGKSFGSWEGRENRSGSVEICRPALLSLLLSEGYLPIVSSVSYDEEGRGININADEAALGIAQALKASRLFFLSDIPGILKEGSPIASLDEKGIRENIENGTISGGMIPKVNSSLEALKDGVSCIVIGEYRSPGDLAGMMANNRGTEITL